MSARSKWIGVILALAVVAVAAVRYAGRGAGAVEVEVAEPVRRPEFRSTVTASGEIVATRYADIGSDVMGRIVSLPVREGDRVRAGQVLARLDAVPAQSDAASAGAQVAALEADERAAAEQVRNVKAGLVAEDARARDAAAQASRLQDLYKRGIAPAADAETARTAAEAAAAQATAARATVNRAIEAASAASRRVAQARALQRRADDALTKTSVLSPIDGIVSRLLVREGEMVVVGIQNQPGTTLMTVSDLSQIDAEVKVAEADVLRLALKQPATVTLEALPGRRFAGTVVEIGASALPVTGAASAREFRVLIRLSQAEAGLRPGLTCDAEIVASERTNVLTVPLQSVVLRADAEGADRPGVFLLRDRRAVFTPVTPGVIGGLEIEVTGVDERARVVVGPFQVLRDLADGAPVALAGRR